MALANLDLMLIGVFVGVLVCVLAMLGLQQACPSDTVARAQMFRSGAIYPYTRVTSLKLTLLLPWRSPPSFEGCHRAAPALLAVARLGAAIAAVSVVLFIALGVWGVAA
jgi:hypothetical protein